MLLNQLGRRDDAAAQFSQAIALNPYEQNSWIGRGLIEYDAGKPDDALRDFSQASQIAPSPMALYWQGRVLDIMGQTKAAVEAYHAALKLAPTLGDARTRMESLEKTEK